jgi:hypothetical protein
MMTRHLLIRDFSGRGASHLSGVIAELRSLGEKASLRLSLSFAKTSSRRRMPHTDLI